MDWHLECSACNATAAPAGLPTVCECGQPWLVRYPERRPDPLRLPRRSPSLRLLQRARDEAHRFGLAYNRNRRKARTITSALLEIPGVGPERRRRLLERFGRLAGVGSASEAEISSIPGFSKALATRIINHLKESRG